MNYNALAKCGKCGLQDGYSPEFYPCSNALPIQLTMSLIVEAGIPPVGTNQMERMPHPEDQPQISQAYLMKLAHPLQRT